MSPDEVRAFLSQGTRTGKLAVSMKHGQPHVMPIWFVLDGDDDLEEIVRDAVWRKELKHHVGEPGFIQPARSMSRIGG